MPRCFNRRAARVVSFASCIARASSTPTFRFIHRDDLQAWFSHRDDLPFSYSGLRAHRNSRQVCGANRRQFACVAQRVYRACLARSLQANLHHPFHSHPLGDPLRWSRPPAVRKVALRGVKRLVQGVRSNACGYHLGALVTSTCMVCSKALDSVGSRRRIHYHEHAV